MAAFVQQSGTVCANFSRIQIQCMMNISVKSFFLNLGQVFSEEKSKYNYEILQSLTADLTTAP